MEARFPEMEFVDGDMHLYLGAWCFNGAAKATPTGGVVLPTTWHQMSYYLTDKIKRQRNWQSTYDKNSSISNPLLRKRWPESKLLNCELNLER